MANPPPHDGSVFSIVGIGASAGGLEAFTKLLEALPPDTGMAFVLVQHLDPDHESALTQILSRATTLPVHEIQNDQPVEPNHVYVIPRDASLRIADGLLKTGRRSRTRVPNRPIDAFFESLAQDVHERAVGVVLSGTGSDGTIGLEAIKAEGGITFAQDDSAKHVAMPHSAIASGSVDLVLSPAEIAAELSRYAKHPFVAGKWPGMNNDTRSASPDEDRATTTPHEDDDSALPSAGSGTPESGGERVRADAKRRWRSTPGHAKGAGNDSEEEAYTRIVLLLRNHSGVDFSLYKSTTIRRRIARRLVLSKQYTLTDYAAFLRGNLRELDSLYSDVLISVTSFFRNPETFEVLEKKVLPNLLNSNGDEPLRCWVLGCSTGQEAYSIAMVFCEAVERSPRLRRLQIFATDLNEALLDKARHGLYARSLVEEISPQRLRRFFVEEEGGYRINKALREMVVFARQNFISDPPFARMDLISCRNVLIYLEPDLQHLAIPTFHYALKPGGTLMLGTSESIGPYSDLFEPVDKKHKVYGRKVAPITSAAISFRAKRRESRTLQGQVQGKESGAVEASDDRISEGNAQREADRVTLTQFAPPGVLVNSALQVMQFRGATGAFLEPPLGKASFDVLKMAREGLMLPLRNALAQARRDNKVVYKKNIRLERNGDTRNVNLQVIPLRNLREQSFLILFQEAGKGTDEPPSSTKRKSKAAPTIRESPSRIRELETALAETRDYLLSMQEQHEAANEALQASNEEVQSANEELQSLNEELETSKEELESANEELTTVNEELQHRNVEVNRLNNDLTNLQSSARLAILLVGRDMSIRRFSHQAEKQFDMLVSHVGRSVNFIRHGLRIVEPIKGETGDNARTTESPLDLEPMIAEVIADLHEKEVEVIDRDGRWHSLRVRPYMTGDNQIDGAVLVLVNIDLLKRSELAVAAARDFADSIVETIREPLLVLNKDLVVARANRSFYRAFRGTAADTIGRLVFDVGNHQWDIPALRELLETVTATDTNVENFEVEHEFASLGRRTMLLNVRRIHDGRDSERILLAIEDVTEPRAAAATRRTLAAIVESSDDAIISISLDGIITSWNRGAERLFGYAQAEALGRHVTMIIPADREAEEDEVFAKIRRGESVEHFDTERQTKDGRLVNVSLTVSPIRNSEGAVTGASKVARDVTERMRLEKSLRQYGAELSQADTRKNEFLAMLGHELRNPLSALTSGLELLARLPDDDQRRRQLRLMMTRQTKRMSILLEQLLDIARVISGKIELRNDRVVLADVVRAAAEAVTPLIEEQQHTLRLSLERDRATLVDGDQVRLIQVVENLLTNAAKYTDRGGEIVVTLESQDETNRITVRDNGIGMSADLIPHVFELFTQAPRTLDRSKGGLGLGLPLVVQLVEMHGGSVSVSSPGLGKGSEFVVTLPRIKDQRASERVAGDTRERVGPESTESHRILIVDDEEDARETLSNLLEASGHQTRTASDGSSALSAARSFDPGVILLDIGMPGMDGYEIARALRAEYGDRILLVAVTGYHGDSALLEQAGFDHHLMKPTSTQKINELLSAWERENDYSPSSET